MLELETFIKCLFPGHEVYEAVINSEHLVKKSASTVKELSKWVTPMNLKYNYLHEQRSENSLSKLKYLRDELIEFRDSFIKAGQNLYTNETINEWLLVYFEPMMDPVVEMMERIEENMKSGTEWLPRPLNVKLKIY